jgi:hypothetical protein
MNDIILRNALQRRVPSTLGSHPKKQKTKPKHKLTGIRRLLSGIVQAVSLNTVYAPFQAGQAQTKRVLVVIRPAVSGALAYFVVPFLWPLSRKLNFVQVLLSDASLVHWLGARSIACL